MKKILALFLSVLMMLMMVAWAEEEQPCMHEHVQILEIEDWDTITVLSCDEKEHTIQLSVYQVTLCEICGKEISSEPLGERVETSPHQFYDGKCSACGYINACPHDSFTRTEKLSEIIGEPVIDENGHSFTGLFVYTLTCDVCGDIVENGTEERIVEGPHEYDESGKCICGKIRPEATSTPQPTDPSTPAPTSTATPEPTQEQTIEPTQTPAAEPTEEPSSEPTSQPTAQPTSEPTEEPSVEPTAETTLEPTGEPTAEPTAEQTFEPTLEPTQAPATEPTPVPTAEPTEAPTQKPSPTARPTAEPQDIPETPELVRRALELCNGIPQDGHATVLGLDDLLTEKEQFAVSQLKPAEQLLVLLDVLGCSVLEESAEDAVLSEQSLDLMISLRERMNTLDNSEKAELSQRVELNFPLREVQWGVESHTARLIEMDVKSDQGKPSLQHYFFYLIGQDGDWMLDRLDED